MSVKIGHLFRCACCGGQFPEDQAVRDNQLGPICKDCQGIIFNLVIPSLANAGLDRPVNFTDVTPWNHKRITT